ncbi:MAG TPA: hypothetical protein VM553_08600 [Dongiaceae bacterium]|nr:hypothetical protein [Dongiaceae bacterium]
MVEISIKYPLSRESALELREPVLAMVLDSLKSVQANEEGFTLNFGRESQIIKPIAQMIEIERVVNSFLRLQLIVESNQGPIKLELSGPAGTRDFLVTDFGLKRWLK